MSFSLRPALAEKVGGLRRARSPLQLAPKSQTYRVLCVAQMSNRSISILDMRTQSVLAPIQSVKVEQLTSRNSDGHA
jgi:hypothetical protein